MTRRCPGCGILIERNEALYAHMLTFPSCVEYYAKTKRLIPASSDRELYGIVPGAIYIRRVGSGDHKLPYHIHAIGKRRVFKGFEAVHVGDVKELVIHRALKRADAKRWLKENFEDEL